MRASFALAAAWLVFQPRFGSSQITTGAGSITCWTGYDATISNTCWYEITCAPLWAITSGYVEPPSDSGPSDNCPAPTNTCATTSTADVLITGLYWLDVTCTSALPSAAATTSIVSLPTSAAAATSIVLLPTAPTLSTPIATVSAVSIQTASTPSTTSPTPVSKIIQSSSTVSLSSRIVSSISSSSSETSSSSTSVTSSSTKTVSTTSSTYPPLPSYTGGDLLRNYCVIPEFTLLPGPQSTIVIYAAFIGCVNDKPDCCPYAVSTVTSTATAIATGNTTRTTTFTSRSTTIISSTTLTTSTSTRVGGVTPSISTVSVVATLVVTSTQATYKSPSPTPIPQLFPTAVIKAQATLSECPQDYHLISSSCCPS
jgi:hypothetical protein